MGFSELIAQEQSLAMLVIINLVRKQMSSIWIILIQKAKKKPSLINKQFY